jgi:outer membrane biosynthesis protein TonB
MRPQPRFEVPRVVKPHPVTEAQRAATPVENAPNSGDSPDFTPGDLLEWEPPDSLLYKFRGTIIVIIELDASGKARSVSMQTGTGDDDIDQDVRVALIKGKYSAARDGDRAIATTLTRRFNILKPK